MKTHLSLAEYDRLSAELRAAWVQLNQAGDTPDSRRSILCLQSALNGVLGVAAALQATADLEATLARHPGFRARRTHAAEILRQLAARADEIRRDPQAVAENVPDALLAHSAIPAIWRLIRGVRDDLRKLRARPYYARLLKQTALGLGAAAAAGLALWATASALSWGARRASDQGCSIAYYSGAPFARLRGHGAERALSKEYGRGAPLPWMRRDGWSARWTGILDVPADAEYSFYAQCEGGLRLWIDDVLLVDAWESPGWTRGVHARRALVQGPHALRLEFRDRGGRSALRVRWTGGPIPPNAEIGPPHLRKR